jgi:hypothetical protein
VTPAGVAIEADRLHDLAALQDEEGCFPSRVRFPHGNDVIDRNSFVTALVVRALRAVPSSSPHEPVRSRALDWLERCRASAPPGAFSFWPQATRPSWAASVPADADDTAVITVELLRHGRLDRAAGLRTACLALVPHRVHPREPATRPPWVAPGSFLTWLVPASAPNPVDLCVNANVVALLAVLDATHLPGYDAAVATVAAGLAWAGGDPARLSALTPFYPDPRCLADALEHAVECGVEQLGDAWREAATLAPASTTPAVWFRSAYGRTEWHAPALDLARAIPHALPHEQRSDL